jgi:lysophospholipase L1-like esterase
MIFPYSAAARCNNPADYRVRCPQKIGLTRNVHKEYAQPLGVCGIAVTAADTHTEMAIIMSEPRVGYSTKRVILLGHSNEGVMPRLRVEGREYYPSYIDNRTDRYLFNLNTAVDSFTVVLPCREGQQFTVSGIYLDNQRPGFSYSSIGVNGAAVPDYLRCTNFVRDLRLLHPDVVIFGIGINDAVPATFDTAAFRQNYLRLIDSVRAVNPSCAFIFITNNDSYIKATRRRYNVNPNGRLAREVFYRLAAETGGAVWDQFEVMGGLKSMEQWRLAGLAQTDRVHFTNAGYQLVGNLFYNALIDAYLKHSGRR